MAMWNADNKVAIARSGGIEALAPGRPDPTPDSPDSAEPPRHSRTPRDSPEPPRHSRTPRDSPGRPNPDSWEFFCLRSPPTLLLARAMHTKPCVDRVRELCHDKYAPVHLRLRSMVKLCDVSPADLVKLASEDEVVAHAFYRELPQWRHDGVLGGQIHALFETLSPHHHEYYQAMFPRIVECLHRDDCAPGYVVQILDRAFECGFVAPDFVLPRESLRRLVALLPASRNLLLRLPPTEHLRAVECDAPYEVSVRHGGAALAADMVSRGAADPACLHRLASALEEQPKRVYAAELLRVLGRAGHPSVIGACAELLLKLPAEEQHRRADALCARIAECCAPSARAVPMCAVLRHAVPTPRALGALLQGLRASAGDARARPLCEAALRDVVGAGGKWVPGMVLDFWFDAYVDDADAAAALRVLTAASPHSVTRAFLDRLGKCSFEDLRGCVPEFPDRVDVTRAAERFRARLDGILYMGLPTMSGGSPEDRARVVCRVLNAVAACATADSVARMLVTWLPGPRDAVTKEMATRLAARARIVEYALCKAVARGDGKWVLAHWVNLHRFTLPKNMRAGVAELVVAELGAAVDAREWRAMLKWHKVCECNGIQAPAALQARFEAFQAERAKYPDAECPFMKESMVFPTLVMPSGISYERDSVLLCLEKSRFEQPVTDYRPNRTLQEFMGENDRFALSLMDSNLCEDACYVEEAECDGSSDGFEAKRPRLS